MKAELKSLLNQLDSIAEEHGEVTDTDVREQMYAAVHHGFIMQTPGYRVPKSYGLFEPEGDAAIQSALSNFIEAASFAAEREGLKTPQLRFDAFQDGSVLSDGGYPYDEYFGHAESFEKLVQMMGLYKP
jgi:hypothetical protein